MPPVQTPPQTLPQTLPADFNGWDQNAPPQTLPADFNGWDKPVNLSSPSPAPAPAVITDKAMKSQVNPGSLTADQAITLSAQADCSLFTQRVLGKAGISVPRTAVQQYEYMPRVPGAAVGKLDPSKLQPGDLVFFDNGLRTPFNTQGKEITDHSGALVGYVNHVGIYQGNGVIVHDPGNGTAAAVPISHFAGMKFMGATRPGGVSAPDTQPAATGHATYEDAIQSAKHDVNVARNAGDKDGLDSANIMLASLQKEGKSGYAARMGTPNHEDEMAAQAHAAQDRYVQNVYGKTLAQLRKEDPGFDLHGVAAANEARARITGQIAGAIKPVTQPLTDIAKMNPITKWLAGHVFGQDVNSDYLGKAAADFATSPLRPLIAAGGVPEDVQKGPLQGVYALGQFVAEAAMLDAGTHGPYSEAVGAVANPVLRPVLKVAAGAAKDVGNALKDVAMAAGGPRAAFIVALRNARGAGVDLEALADSMRGQPELRKMTQVVSREAPGVTFNPAADSPDMADFLSRKQVGPTFTQDQFPGLRRDAFINQAWQQRTEGLVNAMRQEIADVKGAGRKYGPLVRQLEQSLSDGVPHPAIKAELGDIYDAQNPADVHPPALPTESPQPKSFEPVTNPATQGIEVKTAKPAEPPAESPQPAKPPAPTEKPAIPPSEGAPPVVDELSRPRLEDITAAADRIGAELDPKSATTWSETADKAVRDGHVRNALSEAMSLKPNKVTKEHIFGWGIRFQQVERELNAAMADGNDALAGTLNHEGETLLGAIKAANSEAGARLASANALLTDDYGRFALRIKGRKAAGGRALTDAEQGPLDQAASDLAANKNKQQEVLQGRIQNGLNAAPPPGPKRVIVSEETYRKAIDTLRTPTGLTSGIDPEKFAALAQVVGYHIESGVRAVGDLVTKLKADAPGVSDSDIFQAVHDGVASYSAKANAGRGFGEDILTEGKNAIQSSDVAALRKELDQMRSELAKTKNTASEGLLTKLRNQVNQLEGIQGKPMNLDEYKALRAQIGETSRSLNAGRQIDETLLTQGKAGIVDPEIRDLRVQAEKIKMNADRHIKALQAAEDYANLSTLGKGRAQLQDLMNAPRTLKASVDFSAPLRQGIFFTLTHPGLTSLSMPTMFTSFGSKAAYEDLMAVMRASEHFDLARDSGLFIADADAPLLLNHKEEMFASRLAEKVPLVAPSERAYAAFLNKQRFDMFSHYADAAELAGKPLSGDEAKSIANFINVATGRGTGKIADAAAGLGQAFFAPRYTVSRFQLAFGGPLWKSIQETGMNSFATKAIAKEYAKFYGTALTTIGALKYAGVNIGVDPRSTDFGKIVHGNTRVDIFGGMQQPIRLLGQMFYGRVDKDGVFTPPTPSASAGIIGRYLMQKENPMISAPYQLLTGKDLVGGDYDAKRAAVDLLSPLSIQQGWDSVKEEGPLVGGMLIAADAFGAATNIQEPKSDPFGAPYDPSRNGDAVFKELSRIGYAHPIQKGKTESTAEYDARRTDFEKFAYPEIKSMLDDPSFQALTKKEKQIEVRSQFAELTRDYNKGPGAESYDKRVQSMKSPVDAEIAAQQKAGIH